MTAEEPYTTQLQAGLGMIPETLDLLRVWEPGMIPSKLADRVVEDGIFSRATARRARNLAAEMFAPRYLRDGGDVASRMKHLVEHRFPHEAVIQLCYLYTARAQKVFADFVVEVYWPKYSAGAAVISRDDAEQFINRALDTGRMGKRWAESTIKRISGYLIGCCVDFGLLAAGNRGARPIQRFAIRTDITLYLVHDLHFSGLSDHQIVDHRDWGLFGLEPQEVIEQLRNLANDGHLIVQSSGELIQVSWKYRTMEECLDALIKG